MTFETGQIPMGGAALSPVESNVIPASSTTGVTPSSTRCLSPLHL